MGFLCLGGYKMFLSTNGGRRRSLLIAITLLYWFSSSTRISAQNPQRGTISGVVDARETGQPVSGAIVKTEDGRITATTGPLGRFQLDGVPIGATPLKVEAAGFLPLNVPAVQVQANTPTQ